MKRNIITKINIDSIHAPHTLIPQLGSLHEKCERKFRWYRLWHLNVLSDKIHWGVLAVYLIFLIGLSANILFGSSKPVQATMPDSALTAIPVSTVLPSPIESDIPSPSPELSPNPSDTSLVSDGSDPQATMVIIRYWIDTDGGNWNDTANWSATSGGSGGSSVPVAGNFAYFDGGPSHDKIGSVTLDVNVSVATLTFNTYYTGTITQGTSTITTSSTLTFTGTDLTAGAAVTAQNLTISTGRTVNMNGQNLTVAGTFTNDGTLKMTGDESTMTVTNDTDSGTIEYSATSSTRNIRNWTYYGLKINGSGGTFTMPAAITANGPFTLAAGTFNLGANQNFTVKGDFAITNGATFTKGSGTGTLIHDGVSGGGNTFADNSASKQNLGALVIGLSPGTTNMSADLVADSLTVAAGDILNTRGWDLDIGTGGISIAGSLDATDTGGAGYEGDGTIINDADALTISGAGTFTKCTTASMRSTVIMDSGATDNLTSRGQDLGDFQTATASTHIDLQDNLTVQNMTIAASTTLDTVAASNYSVSANDVTLSGTLSGNNSTITVANNWDNSSAGGSYTYTAAGSGTVTLTAADNAATINCSASYWSAGKYFWNINLPTSGTTTITLNNIFVVKNTINLGSTNNTLNGNSQINVEGTGTSVTNNNAIMNTAGNVVNLNYGTSGATNITAGTKYAAVLLRSTANATYTLQGDITCSDYLLVRGNADGVTTTFDLNGNDVTVTGTNGFQVGYSSATTRYGIIQNTGGSDSLITTTAVTVYAGLNNNKILANDTYTINFNVSRLWTMSETANSNMTNSTVTFLGNSAAHQTITTGGQAFYNVVLNNDEGTYDDMILSGNFDVNNDLTLTDGQLRLDTNDPTVTIGGDVTIASIATWTKQDSGATTTFDGTSIFIDNNATKQDIGLVAVNGTSLTLGSSMTVTTMTVTAGTLDLMDSGYTLKILGTGAAATVLSVAGTLDPGTNSTVQYAAINSGGSMNVTTTTYNNLQMTPGAAETYTLAAHLTGANALTGSITIDANATFTTAASYDIALGGSWTNNGAFTHGNRTVTFTSTATGKTINAGASSFYNVIFSGSGGAWSPLTNTMTIANDLTMTAGTFNTATGTANVTVNGTVACGATCGTITMTSAGTNTFLVRVGADENFGTNVAVATNWTFYNLSFENSDGALGHTVTLAGTGTGQVIVQNTLTIGNAGDTDVTTLDANNQDRIINSHNVTITSQGYLIASSSAILYVTGNWSNAGSFNHSNGTVNFQPLEATTHTLDSGGTSNIKTFYNFFNGSDTGTLQLVTNNLNIDGNFSNQTVFDPGTNSKNVTVAGNVNLTTGNYSAGSTTLTLDGSGAQSFTAGGTGAGHNPHDLTITNASAAGVTFTDSLTLSAGGVFTASTASTKLTFNAGSTYTMATLTVNGGAVGTRVKLWSSAASSFTIVPTAGTVTYADIYYSNDTGAAICATYSKDWGNNSGNWDISEGADCNLYFASLTTDKADYPGHGETITVNAQINNDSAGNVPPSYIDYVIFIDTDGDHEPDTGETYVTSGCAGSDTWSSGDYTFQITDVPQINAGNHEHDIQGCANTNFPSVSTYTLWAKWWDGAVTTYATEYTTFTSVPTLTELLFLALVSGAVFLGIKRGGIRFKKINPPLAPTDPPPSTGPPTSSPHIMHQSDTSGNVQNPFEEMQNHRDWHDH